MHGPWFLPVMSLLAAASMVFGLWLWRQEERSENPEKSPADHLYVFFVLAGAGLTYIVAEQMPWPLLLVPCLGMAALVIGTIIQLRKPPPD